MDPLNGQRLARIHDILCRCGVGLSNTKVMSRFLHQMTVPTGTSQDGSWYSAEGPCHVTPYAAYRVKTDAAKLILRFIYGRLLSSDFYKNCEDMDKTVDSFWTTADRARDLTTDSDCVLAHEVLKPKVATVCEKTLQPIHKHSL